MLQENGGSLVQAMRKLRLKILLGFSVEKQCDKVRIMGCLRVGKTLPGKVQAVCVFPLGLKILFGFWQGRFSATEQRDICMQPIPVLRAFPIHPRHLALHLLNQPLRSPNNHNQECQDFSF